MLILGVMFVAGVALVVNGVRRLRRQLAEPWPDGDGTVLCLEDVTAVDGFFAYEQTVGSRVELATLALRFPVLFGQPVTYKPAGSAVWRPGSGVLLGIAIRRSGDEFIVTYSGVWNESGAAA